MAKTVRKEEERCSLFTMFENERKKAGSLENETSSGGSSTFTFSSSLGKSEGRAEFLAGLAGLAPRARYPPI